MIHNFSKEIKVKNSEVKKVDSAVSKPKTPLPETPKRVAKQPMFQAPVKVPSKPKKDFKPKLPPTPIPKPSGERYAGEIPKKAPAQFYESPEIQLPTNETKNKIITETQPCADYIVHKLGDVYNGRRHLMNHIGIDIGTKTVVIAYKGENGVEFLSEINGYWPFERSSPFIKNMLNDPDKIRSDGTQRPARWIELGDAAVVLGRDAEEFAYAKNDTLLRPMAEGGITQDEEAMTVLASIVQGLLEMAENEIGHFSEDGVKICYCTTAASLNKENNIGYHERVVNMIIDGYETKVPMSRSSIKESHAIVLDMDEGGEGTGIGVSWGAGTVTVSYVKYGMEVYSFCWVGAGDWIDNQVAQRHGYDPDAPKSRKKKAKETPTTVAKRKMKIDLTPGKEPADRLDMDIILHYDLLIENVVIGIIQGFEENESEARIDDAINVYMAGGTSSPDGFAERVAAKFDERGAPFDIGSVKKSDKPLYSVATGCLKAAEYGIAD